MKRFIYLAMCVFACGVGFGASDPADWPMYNRDVLGSRHNPAERTIGVGNAREIVEKWRFPAKDSGMVIGVVHATPSVVDGEVYFGTATDAAFYKLGHDGSLKWKYRNPTRPAPKPLTDEQKNDNSFLNRRFAATTDSGILTSALVTDDTVYFGDVGGWYYALDRETGGERWKLNTRGSDFPGAHRLNSIFASPIMAGGKLIIAGGAIEQVVYGMMPGYRGCTGRGFVAALEPKTGRVLWKYDVGPKPEALDPPVVIEDAWGKHKFYFGPATSIVWSTPTYDAETNTLFFGTDVNTAPRKPTPDNPRMDTPESCAVIAIDARDGSQRWATQINRGDVWTNAMRSYDPDTGLYKDQSIGDSPKLYTIDVDGTATKVVGVGCKNGGFYVLHAGDGHIIAETPTYHGAPTWPPSTTPDPRMLAFPSAMGGLQTGCATDGTSIFTNGIDALRMGSSEKMRESAVPPTGGRVVSLSLDLKTEHWRHERPTVAKLGGPPPKPAFENVGDPVASGIAVANGVAYFTAVASGKLVALDARNGTVLREIALGPVWAGPSVSRGRIYVGSGNTLFNAPDWEAYFPKRYTGTVYCFGLPGDDEREAPNTRKP